MFYIRIEKSFLIVFRSAIIHCLTLSNFKINIYWYSFWGLDHVQNKQTSKNESMSGENPQFALLLVNGSIYVLWARNKNKKVVINPDDIICPFLTFFLQMDLLRCRHCASTCDWSLVVETLIIQLLKFYLSQITVFWEVKTLDPYTRVPLSTQPKTLKTILKCFSGGKQLLIWLIPKEILFFF